MQKQYSKTIINTVMLYILTGAKTVFPLIILPYLARVLTVECYGMVSYVKAAMGYAQILIDFGFMLSAVKEIVEAKQNKKIISEIIGDTIISKLLLSVVAVTGIFLMTLNINLLKDNFMFVCLSVFVPVLSSFLMDFLFRGIEKMHIITIIFVFMKSISTILTILIIKSDSEVLFIPIFDIISSVAAIALSWIIVKKLGYSFKFTNIKNCLNKIKSSFGYFANSMASTAFGTLNTIIIGIFIKDAQQIAFWSICIQIIGAIQNMYVPISNGIYPYMIKSKDLRFIKKILLIFTPLICVGTVICYIISPLILNIVAGEKYIEAANIFRALLPVIIMSFPVAILGWPALGAINKVKETTFSTLYGALAQILGIFVLILLNKFTVINIAILRNLSEFVMLFMREYYMGKFKKLFFVFPVDEEKCSK